MLGAPVRHSAELARIIALPRRALDLKGDGAHLAAELSAHLRLPGSQAQLRPIQALGLREAYEMRGLFAAVPVGGGKTLLSYLMPTVLQAKRPLLLVPANLKEKTSREFTRLSRDWVSPRPPYQVESYTSLDIVQGAARLIEYKPDLIFCDEADELRNNERTASRRIKRYLADNPGCMFVCTTGTISRKSIRDYAHLLQWSLQNNSPVPNRWVDLEEWANALDEKVDALSRTRVGSLLSLCDASLDNVADELAAARSGFRRRLQESPGVLITDDSECDQPLSVRCVLAPPDKALDDAFKNFRELWLTPDEWPLSDPLSVFRHASELGCGFYYKWDPRPPAEWLSARTEWFTFVREQIKNSQRSLAPLDTMAQVAARYPQEPSLLNWRKVWPTFKPHTVPVWLTSSVLGMASDFVRTPGIVWVSHNAVGEALSRMFGLQYFGAGGITRQGDSIELVSGKRAIVASTAANRKGRNLQDRFCRNLVFGHQPSAERFEQVVGRTHRAEQYKPVDFQLVIGCAENVRALEKTWNEAAYVRATIGHTQKILRAQVSTVKTPNGYRWET